MGETLSRIIVVTGKDRPHIRDAHDAMAIVYPFTKGNEEGDFNSNVRNDYIAIAYLEEYGKRNWIWKSYSF